MLITSDTQWNPWSCESRVLLVWDKTEWKPARVRDENWVLKHETLLLRWKGGSIQVNLKVPHWLPVLNTVVLSVNRTERVRWIYQLMGQWEASGQDLGVWASERADVGVGWTGGGQVCEVAPVRSEKNTDKKSLTSNSDILTTYKLIQMKHSSKTLNASNRK